eukprot:6276938-Amphidinium_carterae.1
MAWLVVPFFRVHAVTLIGLGEDCVFGWEYILAGLCLLFGMTLQGLRQIVWSPLGVRVLGLVELSQTHLLCLAKYIMQCTMWEASLFAHRRDSSRTGQMT